MDLLFFMVKTEQFHYSKRVFFDLLVFLRLGFHGISHTSECNNGKLDLTVSCSCDLSEE